MKSIFQHDWVFGIYFAFEKMTHMSKYENDITYVVKHRSGAAYGWT